MRYLSVCSGIEAASRRATIPGNRKQYGRAGHALDRGEDRGGCRLSYSENPNNSHQAQLFPEWKEFVMPVAMPERSKAI